MSGRLASSGISGLSGQKTDSRILQSHGSREDNAGRLLMAAAKGGSAVLPCRRREQAGGPRRRRIPESRNPVHPGGRLREPGRRRHGPGLPRCSRGGQRNPGGLQRSQGQQRRTKEADETRGPGTANPVATIGERVQNASTTSRSARCEGGNEILLDSVEVWHEIARTVWPRTLAKTRKDVDEQRPKLAGPVFDEVHRSDRLRQASADPDRRAAIRHAGLARLRILRRSVPC